MQRVALGRAIVKNVPMFLMDEPLSNLDAKLRSAMRSEIVNLHNNINATTIYVTHDQTEAMTMATKIVVMSRGFIQQISSPEEVYNNPANIFVAKFIGSPAMNIFEMEINREKVCLQFGDWAIPLDTDFVKRHDLFYSQKAKIFEDLEKNFNYAAHEYVLKILSSTGEKFNTRKKDKRKNSLIEKIKSLYKKKDVDEEYLAEKDITKTKRQQLVGNLSANHKLFVGIRPEKLKIEKYVSSKKYENSFVIKPTVLELLGAYYNVYFNFFGKNLVGQISSENKITIKDDIVVFFSEKDLYIFDPITGDRI
jgi:ABC-type sugar transport system ATPase subunit